MPRRASGGSRCHGGGQRGRRQRARLRGRRGGLDRRRRQGRKRESPRANSGGDVPGDRIVPRSRGRLNQEPLRLAASEVAGDQGGHIRRYADVCGQGCLSIRKDRTGRVAEQQRRRATRGEGLEQGIRAPVAVEITDDQCEVER